MDGQEVDVDVKSGDDWTELLQKALEPQRGDSIEDSFFTALWDFGAALDGTSASEPESLEASTSIKREIEHLQRRNETKRNETK